MPGLDAKTLGQGWTLSLEADGLSCHGPLLGRLRLL